MLASNIKHIHEHAFGTIGCKLWYPFRVVIGELKKKFNSFQGNYFGLKTCLHWQNSVLSYNYPFRDNVITQTNKHGRLFSRSTATALRVYHTISRRLFSCLSQTNDNNTP